mgnify:CR=1 FL=1|tara:strand:+ start:173 stop:400 length:228 start_codon:yes stop_codon:yes gene_type:complete
MSYGYSARVVKENLKASGKLAGVKLGRACIKKDIPVATVARIYNVSRQTVYNWFTGTSSPSERNAVRIQQYLSSI